MRIPTFRYSSVLLASATALALAACSSGSSGMSASTGTSTGTQTPPGGGSTQPTTLTSAPAGTTLNLTTHQGLEAYTITNGAAVKAGGVPTGTFQPGPTGNIVTTSNGFTMTLPDARTVTFDTSAASTQSIGPQQYQTTVAGTTNLVSTTLTGGSANTLTYSTYGTWTETDAAGAPLVYGTFASGIPTTTGQMPTTGTANYSGKLTGSVVTSTVAANISGNMSLHADFVGNTIDGGVTGITATDLATKVTGSMNDINLRTGVISNLGFTGNAATAVTTQSLMLNVPDLVGSFGGRFYGPSAAEAAGSMTMTGGGATLIGVFGTKKN